MFKDFENQQPTERKASALGSGFIIKESGIVITNNHVIANAEDILVRVGDKEYKAKLVGTDPYMDVAVLKMETKDKFKPVEFVENLYGEEITGKYTEADVKFMMTSGRIDDNDIYRMIATQLMHSLMKYSIC